MGFVGGVRGRESERELPLLVGGEDVSLIGLRLCSVQRRYSGVLCHEWFFVWANVKVMSWGVFWCFGE